MSEIDAVAYLVGYGYRIVLIRDGWYGVVGHRVRPFNDILTGSQLVRLVGWIEKS